MRTVRLYVVVAAVATAVLFLGAYLATDRVYVKIETPSVFGVEVPGRQYCGSVVAPVHERLTGEWHYSSSSCKQNLSTLRRISFVLIPSISALLYLFAYLLLLRSRRSRRLGQPGSGDLVPTKPLPAIDPVAPDPSG